MPSHTLNPAALDGLSLGSLASAARILDVEPSALFAALSGAPAPSVAPAREYIPVDVGHVQGFIDLLQDQLAGSSDVPVTHYAPKGSTAEAIVEGTTVTAYCGAQRMPGPYPSPADRRPCDLCGVLQVYGLRMAS